MVTRVSAVLSDELILSFGQVLSPVPLFTTNGATYTDEGLNISGVARSKKRQHKPLERDVADDVECSRAFAVEE